MTKICFIACAVGDPESDVRKHAEMTCKHIITPAAKSAGYQDVRADLIQRSGIVSAQVIQHLVEADAVVADLTGLNPNVFYELAVRHLVGKPFIQICTTGTEIPFDVQDVRTLFYDLKNPDSVVSTRKAIAKLLKSFTSNSEPVISPLTSTLRNANYVLVQQRPVSYTWDHAAAVLNTMATDIERDFAPEVLLTMSGPGSFVASYILSLTSRSPILVVSQTFPMLRGSRSLDEALRQCFVDSGYLILSTTKWDIVLSPVLARLPSGTKVAIIDDKVLSGESQRLARELLTSEYGLDVRCAALTAPHGPAQGVLDWVGEVCTVRHYFPWGSSEGRYRA
ncbi:MAG: hypothetical protein ACRCY9_11430 [Phycicoccus sp.]